MIDRTIKSLNSLFYDDETGYEYVKCLEDSE